MNTSEATTQENPEVVTLKKTVTHLETQIKSVTEALRYANEQLDWFRRNLFGKRSEKIITTIQDPGPVFPGLEDYFNTTHSQKEGEEKSQTVQKNSSNKRKKNRKT